MHTDVQATTVWTNGPVFLASLSPVTVTVVTVTPM